MWCAVRALMERVLASSAGHIRGLRLLPSESIVGGVVMGTEADAVASWGAWWHA